MILVGNKIKYVWNYEKKNFWLNVRNCIYLGFGFLDFGCVIIELIIKLKKYDRFSFFGKYLNIINILWYFYDFCNEY